jgi:hypothetical protein
MKHDPDKAQSLAYLYIRAEDFKEIIYDWKIKRNNHYAR